MTEKDDLYGVDDDGSTDELEKEDEGGGADDEASAIEKAAQGKAKGDEDEGGKEGDGKKADEQLKAIDPEVYAKLKQDYENVKGAMAEERQGRRALEKDIAKMEERFAMFLESAQKKQPEKTEAEISADEDPIGHLVQQNQKLIQRVTGLEAEVQTYRENGKMSEEMSNELMRTANLANEFIKEKPDYPKAYQHYVNSRADELKELGFDGPELAKKLEEEVRGIVQRSLKAEKNPASVFYSLAGKRGYSPEAKADELAGGKDDKSGKDLKKLKKDMDQNDSLSGAGGGSKTLRELANADDDEFDSARKEMGF